jgi:acyl-CoA synthetase (AMP-forming)/AMP-acid ligase II
MRRTSLATRQTSPRRHLLSSCLAPPRSITTVVHRTTPFTSREFYDRCRRFANARRGPRIDPGDPVAVMATNTLALLEAHCDAPMTGAVLNARSYYLDAYHSSP